MPLQATLPPEAPQAVSNEAQTGTIPERDATQTGIIPGFNVAQTGTIPGRQEAQTGTIPEPKPASAQTGIIPEPKLSMAQPSSSSNKITLNEARELLRQHDASMPNYDRIWREIDQEERRVREELTNAQPGDPILGPVEPDVPKPPPMRKAPPMQSTAQPVRSPQYKAPPKQLSMAKASQPSSSSNTVPPAAPLTLPFEVLTTKYGTVYHTNMECRYLTAIRTGNVRLHRWCPLCQSEAARTGIIPKKGAEIWMTGWKSDAHTNSLCSRTENAESFSLCTACHEGT
eukprot:s1164_g19.t1